MNRLIALCGPANTGKSSSIKLAYEKLQNLPGAEVVRHEATPRCADMTAIITVNGAKVGLESRGEDPERLSNSLRCFEKYGCQLIVCATRTRGGSVDAVEKFCNDNEREYKLRWIRMGRESSPDKQEASENILRAVRDLIGNGDCDL